MKSRYSRSMHDSRFRQISLYTIRISDDLAFRISSDTRPHNLMTAKLQKGLRFIYRGREMVGEGTGFGVPVLLYSNDTYFSGSSRVLISTQGNTWIIRKEYDMNRVQRKQMRGVRLENSVIRTVWRYLDRLYQKHRHLQPAFSHDILGKLRIHLEFVETKSVGKVIATYSINHDRIKVRMDFDPIERTDLRKMFVLNEQGSRFFRKYSDSRGGKLIEREIGGWGIVNAESARITDQKGRIGFQLWANGSGNLYKGREFVKDLADWVGLDYEIGPFNRVLEYKIRMLGV
jgi:hypothetical protein